MDEARWLSCEDPRKMLEWLRQSATDRKLRLFACAFWREWWQPAPEAAADDLDTDILSLLEYAEHWGEGVPPTRESRVGFGFGWHPLIARNAFDAANWTIRETAGFKSRMDCMRYDPKDREKAAALQVALLRDIFGNPFRSCALDPRWLTPPVVNLASTVYDERRFDELPILADALEEAGCTAEEILTHCRTSEKHVCGCWVLDQMLGRE